MGFALAHQLIAAEGQTPRRWLAVLHGIMGRGGNWRSFARHLVRRRPELGAVLVDLRMHGRSVGAPGPHTLHSAASDVARLVESLSHDGVVVDAVLGHSFGGKVALELRGNGLLDVSSTWIIDATPSAQPTAMRGSGAHSVVGVLAFLEQLPRQMADRAELVARAVDAGLPRPLGQWLAMNLERDGDHVSLRLDLAAVRALLMDTLRQDLWPAVTGEWHPGRVHFIVAGRQSALSSEDVRRLETVAADAPMVDVSVIADAGHWVHVDAPDELLEIVVATI